MKVLMIAAVAVAAAPATTSDTADASENATIIMYRGSGVFGAAIACPIRYRGQEIVELGRGKFAEWRVPPGSYILTNKTASVEVNISSGQTKYVRCQVKSGFLTGRSDLQIVDRESFAEHQSDFERKEVVTVNFAQ